MDLSGPKFFNSPSSDRSSKLNHPAVVVKPSPETAELAGEWRKGTGKMRVSEFPATPGRPVFGFSGAVSKKGFPSKWDDAEKWLVSSPSCASPAHADAARPPPHNDVLLKDKFTEDPARVPGKGFFFRDIGTEMTPLGSSKTSRCNTPYKDDSPSRHNTPASISGPLGVSQQHQIDLTHLQECHFAKMQLGAQYDAALPNWTSREEEEEDVSKSLRHSNLLSPWQQAEKAKCCLRYQREEAKIHAWVNLQKAKVEAQSKKLEVKILKMRSKQEEKMMRKMANVHKKAEERKATLRQEHSEQIQRAKLQFNQRNCSCFPRSSHY